MLYNAGKHKLMYQQQGFFEFYGRITEIIVETGHAKCSIIKSIDFVLKCESDFFL